MMTRIAWLGSLLGCCLLVSSVEPAAQAADPNPEVKKTESAGELEGKRGQLMERLKQLKEMKKGEGGTPGGAEGKGKLADMLKQLKGKNREPLDLNKFKRTTWKVGEETREALIYAPPVKDPKEKRPVVFAFHGHGGTAEFAARKIAFHETWPEAISIYPQGLPTAVPKIDPEGRMPGWQKYVGDQDNRDLLFFDAMLKTLATDYQIDADRVYACGHSNGGYMSYVLLAGRGDQLAAVAPIAATHDVRNFKDTKPKPVFHVAGERDPLVKFAAQERSIEQIRKLNGCDEAGKPAGEFCTEYSSKNGPPVVAYLHPGAHEVPAGSIKLITEFFQKHTRGKVDGAPRVNFYPQKP